MSEYFIRRIASLAAVQLSGLVVAKVLRQQPLNMWDIEVRISRRIDYRCGLSLFITNYVY